MSQHNFPELRNDSILRVCKGEIPDRLPIWFTRLTGPLMLGYRELRKRYTFFSICENPDLAAEVTLMPLKYFDLDAAIIFSDILVIPKALGMIVEMNPAGGPVLPRPITLETVKDLKLEGVLDRLRYVGNAITRARHRLDGHVPVIGFAGAPWTLMVYMLEGGRFNIFNKSKKWLYANSAESMSLLNMLADIVIDFLVMQAEAGAQILQIFENHAGALNKKMYMTFGIPYLRKIKTGVATKLAEKNLEAVPLILYIKGAHYCLPELADLGYDVLSVDWTIEPLLVRALRAKQPNLIIQGNLDPCALYSSKEDVTGYILNMVQGFGVNKYIFNLGHDILPDVEMEAIRYAIEVIHGIEVD